MLVDALQTYLSSDAAVSTQLGIPRSDKTTGIFPVTAPSQVPMPYIVMSQITGEPTTTSSREPMRCRPRAGGSPAMVRIISAQKFWQRL